MNFPERILNGSCTIYREVNAKGDFGQMTQVLVKVLATRCRVDQKSTTRTATGGSFEQTTGRYTVYLSGIQAQPIEDKYWIKVVTNTGITFTAQVASVSIPAMLDHHTELEVVKRAPALEVPA